MAPKFLIFVLLIAFPLNQSKISSARAKAVIHITNGFPGNNSSNVNIQIKAKRSYIGTFELKHRGQEYHLKADTVHGVYYSIAICGLKFVSFHVYDPKRDKGHAAVYWWVDDWGFHISYDKAKWKKNAAWESE